MSTSWEPRRRIEQAYRRAIQTALRKPEGFLTGLDDPVEIIRALREFSQNPWFERYAEALALDMITHLLTDSGRTWRQAARESSKGRLIHADLQKELQGPLGGIVANQIQENAAYITGVSKDISIELTQYVLESSMQGVRASEIANQLRERYKHLSAVKVNLIARTETSKTSTALMQARSQLYGIDWYRWRTSEDARVRHSHRLMDDVLVSWDDPPSPEALDGTESVGHYHAGCIWNCRCYTEPLIDLDFISWPARVYRNGAIATMTRKQFEQLIKRKQAV